MIDGWNHGHSSSIDLRWRKAAWDVVVVEVGAGVEVEVEVVVPEGLVEEETVPEGADEEDWAAWWGRMRNHTIQKTIPATMIVASRARKMASGLLVYQRIPSFSQRPTSPTATSFLSIDIIFIASPHFNTILLNLNPKCYSSPPHPHISLATTH